MTSLCRMREYREFWQDQVRKRAGRRYPLAAHNLAMARRQVAICDECIERQAQIQLDLVEWLISRG